jgi:hypothetical protein
MTKFNGMERMLIHNALSNHSIELENWVKEHTKEGKTFLYAEGFWATQVKHLLRKVDTMTRKKDLNRP